MFRHACAAHEQMRSKLRVACPICRSDRVLADCHALRLHSASVHARYMRFRCTECACAFPNQGTGETHWITKPSSVLLAGGHDIMYRKLVAEVFNGAAIGWSGAGGSGAGGSGSGVAGGRAGRAAGGGAGGPAGGGAGGPAGGEN